MGNRARAEEVIDALLRWEEGAPPNEEVVEVEVDRRHVIRVRAILGRDGTLPHWESEDRDTLWSPSAFKRWRRLQAR